MKLINPGNIYGWPNPTDPLQTKGPVWYFASHKHAERYMDLMYPDSAIPPKRRREFMLEIESSTLPNQQGFVWLPVTYPHQGSRLHKDIWGVVASSVDAALEFNLRVQAGTSLNNASRANVFDALNRIRPAPLYALEQEFAVFR